MKQSIIKIDNLSKTYKDGTVALENINLDINKGEIIALLGPNGAGKTTLISAICGITNISSGNVSVDGYDVIKNYKKTRALIGLVPQEIALQPFEKVIDVVRYSRNLFGCANDDVYIENILKRLLLWDKKNKRIVELSGGMKRRVIIAKALCHEPKVLFLDEPTAGVDVDLRLDMWDLIKKLRHDGTTIILTTHYIEEAEEIADRISIIDNGKILLTEIKDQLIQRLGKKAINIKLDKDINIMKFKGNLNLSQSSDKSSITLHHSDTGNEHSLDELLSKIKAERYKVLNIETNEKSLEEIFLDLVRK